MATVSILSAFTECRKRYQKHNPDPQNHYKHLYYIYTKKKKISFL